MTLAALTPPGKATGNGHRGATRRRTRLRRRAFTLIETYLATIIVGVGVLAMVSAQAAFHQANAWSTHASTAMALANEIREMTWNLPRRDPVTGDAEWGAEDNEFWFGDFDDLDDFDDLIFSADLDNGPINANRQIIQNMDGWSQIVRVFNVDPFNITSEQTDGSTKYMGVQVIVTYQAPNQNQPKEMTRVSWVAPR